MRQEVEETAFSIVAASDEDWPWMTDAYERTAWESLHPSRQRQISRQEVRRHTREQVGSFRAQMGQSFHALLARDAAGRRAGFIWLEQSHHGFTGESRVYVLEVYVSGAYRRRGVGRQLVEAAEAWGRDQGLEQIALNVAAHNTPARSLYESLGFHVDSVRMSKALQENQG